MAGGSTICTPTLAPVSPRDVAAHAHSSLLSMKWVSGGQTLVAERLKIPGAAGSTMQFAQNGNSRGQPGEQRIGTAHRGSTTGSRCCGSGGKSSRRVILWWPSDVSRKHFCYAPSPQAAIATLPLPPPWAFADVCTVHRTPPGRAARSAMLFGSTHVPHGGRWQPHR